MLLTRFIVLFPFLVFVVKYRCGLRPSRDSGFLDASPHVAHSEVVLPSSAEEGQEEGQEGPEEVGQGSGHHGLPAPRGHLRVELRPAEDGRGAAGRTVRS